MVNEFGTNEFDAIARYLAPLAGEEGLGLKDDCAIIQFTDTHDMVVTKDIIIEGVHLRWILRHQVLHINYWR